MCPEDLHRLSRVVIQFYEKMFSWEGAIAKNSGLSPQQNHTIEIVGEEGPIRMKPLADKLGVTTGTLTVMIDRLQKADYVERKNDPDDRRAFNIVLTEKGKQVHNEHHAYHSKLAEDISGCLKEEEAKQFVQMLEQINTIF
ncbi:MarR family transcriptional regulator [bacterium]|nr:MarR family transcriptional regulator [bacterium]